ncbi:hypothetical protein ACLOJK_010832 [Asimina triloba]
MDRQNPDFKLLFNAETAGVRELVIGEQKIFALCDPRYRSAANSPTPSPSLAAKPGTEKLPFSGVNSGPCDGRRRHSSTNQAIHGIQTHFFFIYHKKNPSPATKKD